MKYNLVKTNNNDIDRLIRYKKDSIFSYSNNLSKEEVDRINNYINNEINNDINDYFDIVINNKIVGSILLKEYNDGLLLDEIYIEDEYRNKKIGSTILKDLISKNNIIYLWVYKENVIAFSLYKKLGFNIIEETNTRYFMKYSK